MKLSSRVVEGDSYLNFRYASQCDLSLLLELTSYALCSLNKVCKSIWDISWTKFHQVSTLDVWNCKDFYLVLIIVFCINKLSYSFSLCLDKYGSMVMIKFITLFYLIASYCNFWIYLLHIAWVMSSFTTSSCLCIVLWSYSLN